MKTKIFEKWEDAITYAMSDLSGRGNHRKMHRQIIKENNKYKVIEVKNEK